MTTGVESGERIGSEKKEEREKDGKGGGGGHRKMAAALSHILSGPSVTPEGEKRVRKKKRRKDEEGEEVGTLGKRKRLHKEEKIELIDSEPEDGIASSDENEDDDVISNAGDVVAGCRWLPDASTLDYERKLQRIATTGVVQLFNAVSQHTKQVQEKMKAAGNSERKRAKVLSSIDKGSFIDLLKGRRPDDDKKKWLVLKEDYMMKAKMRDWDKKEEDKEEGEVGEEKEGEHDSESDSD